MLAAVRSELQGDGIDTSLILRAAGHPSPFTYIIVDREGECFNTVQPQQHHTYQLNFCDVLCDVTLPITNIYNIPQRSQRVWPTAHICTGGFISFMFAGV
jgi:hypothetical protein